MEEFDENKIEKDVKLTLETGDWVCKEYDKLILKYKACKTEHARNKLMPQLEYMRKRLSFECNQITKLMSYDEFGNDIDE